MAEEPRYSEELVGRKLVLKRIRPDAIPDRYLEFLHDPEVTHYLQARFVEHTAQSLRQFVEGFDHADRFLFGVHAKSDDTFIGTGTLRVNPVHLFSNLGYMIGDKVYWKGDTALELCHLLLDFAFGERRVRKILEVTTGNHIASNFNFKRIGFTLAANIPDLYWGDGKYQSGMYWTLDIADWAAMRSVPCPEIEPPGRP